MRQLCVSFAIIIVFWIGGELWYHHCAARDSVEWSGRKLIIWVPTEDGVEMYYPDTEFGWRGGQVVTRPWRK